MHLEDETLERLLHDELAPGIGDDPRRHLAGCAECQSRLETARHEEQLIFSRLALLDRPVPVVDPAELAERARRPTVQVGRWAAAVTLTLAAAGAAYATPGSPVPGWVRSVVEWITRPAATVSLPEPMSAPELAGGGIALSPGARLSIRFEEPQRGGSVTVSLVEGALVTARAARGTARFTSDRDRLVIDNHGSTADYELELPRDAPWVEVRVGPTRVLLKQGLQVLTAVAPDSAGRYIVPLTPPVPE